MDSLGRILALLFFSSLLVLQVDGQSLHTFNWGFTGSKTTQLTFSECDTLPLHIIPINGSNGSSPYYMMSYAVQGTTMVTPLGDDPDQLSWQVKHTQGSQLLLTVVDSVGNSGGFGSQLFEVQGGDTSCQPSPPSDPAVISPNVTTTISTCQPWGLTIKGGVKPYTVSLAALNQPVVTNISMGQPNDVLTFIDRADPGTQILAAVVDGNGQWGISSGLVKTAGSKDTECLGLVSTSQTQAQIQADAAAAAASSSPKAKGSNRTAIAIGIVFGLLMPLILVGVGFWWWRRRKRMISSGVVSGQDARPRPYDPGMQERAERPSLNLDTAVVRVNSQTARTPSWMVDSSQQVPVRPSDSPTSLDMTSMEIQSSTVPTPFLTSLQVRSTVASIAHSPQLPTPPSAVSRPMSFARTPITPRDVVPFGVALNSTSPAATLSPAQRYRKALEVHAEAQAARARLASGSGSGSGSPSTSSAAARAIAGPSSRPIVRRSQTAVVQRQFPVQPVSRRAGSSLRLPPVTTIPEAGPDIIIQHRDGGIVEELPPPYPVDRYPTTPRLPQSPARQIPSPRTRNRGPEGERSTATYYVQTTVDSLR